MPKRLKHTSFSQSEFAVGQELAFQSDDARLQYLSGRPQGSAIHCLDFDSDEHDNCCYLGYRPKNKLPVIVEHEGTAYGVATDTICVAQADIVTGTLPSGELLEIAQPLSEAQQDDVHQCEHDWFIYSTDLSEVSLLVLCAHCSADGSVDDPDSDEWADAFDAASKPLRWTDKSRVTIRGCFDPEPLIIPINGSGA